MGKRSRSSPGSGVLLVAGFAAIVVICKYPWLLLLLGTLVLIYYLLCIHPARVKVQTTVSKREEDSSPQEQARSWIKENALILDAETTGLDKTAQIVDIAIIDLDGNVLLNTLVMPTRRIPTTATAIHGITNKMVFSAPTWAEIHDQFLQIVKDRKVIVYNCEYDARLILQTMAEHGLSFSVSSSFACAMVAYANFFGEWNEYRKDFKWQKLSDAAKQQGIEVIESHRALSDCKTTLGLIKAMAG